MHDGPRGRIFAPEGVTGYAIHPDNYDYDYFDFLEDIGYHSFTSIMTRQKELVLGSGQPVIRLKNLPREYNELVDYNALALTPKQIKNVGKDFCK